MTGTVEQVVALAGAAQLPEVRLLRPQPGDVVVVRLDELSSEQDMHYLSERVREVVKIPDIPVLVLGPGANVEVVRRDGE